MRKNDPYFQFGHWGEGAIRLWLQEQGFFIVRTADIRPNEASTTGAPLVEGKEASIILPDLLAVRGGVSRWVEVKTKTKAAWYKNGNRYQHGLPARQWDQYLLCERESGIEGWLAILEREPRPLVLLAPFHQLRERLQRYVGAHMPGGEPHVYFPRDDFNFYDAPVGITFPESPPSYSAASASLPTAPVAAAKQYKMWDL